MKRVKILCCNFLFALFGLFGVHKTRNRIAILHLIHTMPILYYNFINLNTVENTPIPYQTYEANIHLWLQTLMNVRALKQTSVTPVPFVQTQQDPTFVGAWKDIRVMAETVLVNNTSSWSLLSTSGSLFCYTVLDGMAKFFSKLYNPWYQRPSLIHDYRCRWMYKLWSKQVWS